MKKLCIEYRALSDLKPRANNPRKHSKRQIEQIAKSIEKYGFVNPVIVDDDGIIVAGHGRFAAAQLRGLTDIPIVRLSGMSKADIRAYVIADNRLAENSEWDKDLLKLELQELSDLDYDFDLTVTGFDLAEIDGLIGFGAAEDTQHDPDDKVPQLAEVAITRRGDVWQIADHRLICGDATDPATFAQLLGDEQATVVYGDPPYNVPINGHVSGLGKTQHREFAMASGEMSKGEYTSFLCRVFVHLARFSVDGSIHFQCIDWRHLTEMLQAGDANYTELKNICVWAKPTGGMGSFYRSAHELVLVFKSGNSPHINNIELGKNGRYRTNVWNYPGASSFSATRSADLAMHPTVKPTALVRDAILDCSRRKDIVLDPFAGSGTTLVAAQRTKRRGYGIEIDPLYCDTIIRRMQTLFKLPAIRISDGLSFQEVCEKPGRSQAEETVA